MHGSQANAALEWQARSWGWRSWELVAACPLEGLVRRFRFPQTRSAIRYQNPLMFRVC